MFDESEIQELKKYVYAVYILQALGFVLPITPIIGIIVDYIKDDDARGTWLESHYLWQIRTFWIALPVTLVGSFTTFLLVGWLFLGAVWLWVVYRAIKGWLRLYREDPIDDPRALL